MPKSLFLPVFLALLTTACSLPTTREAGIRHVTTPAFDIPPDIVWREVSFAKEIIHTRKMLVFLSGGPHPIPLEA